LVKRAGGVQAASDITGQRPEIVQRWGVTGNKPNIFVLNKLQKVIRERQESGGGGGPVPVGMGPVPGDAASFAPAAAETNGKPRGFAAADAVDISPAPPEPPAGKLSLFPPRPAPSASVPMRSTPSRPPSDASPLGVKEANEFYDLLKNDILPTVADWADWAISHTNRAQAPAVIWSDLEDDELDVLADAMISVARINPAAAQAVRGVVWAWKRVKVGIITVPRFLMTVDHYAENGGIYLPMPATLGRALRSRSRQGARGPKGAPS
jgi:hypothetical protein